MTILAQDTFVRANQSGSWGTASDGNPWSRLAGNSTLAISSNQGTITGSNQNNVMALSSGTAGDQEVVCNVTVNGSADIGGVALRINSSGNTFYTARIGTFGNLLDVAKYVNGTQTGLDLQSFTYTTGVAYSIKLQMIGTTLKAKIWQAGQSEPSSWLSTVTDSSISSGRYGVYGNPFTAGANFDHFVADDTSSSSTNTRTIPASAALLSTNTRTIPGTATLLQISTRTVPARIALLATSTRTIPVMVALLQTNMRAIPVSASLVNARMIPVMVALLATSVRTIPAFASLSGAGPATNALVLARSGQAQAFVRSGKALVQIREP